MKSFNINNLLIFIALLSGLVTLPASAQDAPPAAPTRQDLNALGPVVERFLTIQSIGLPGKMTTQLGRIDPRLNLAPCAEPEAFLPKGGKIWGKTMVGIRCSAPVEWVVYMPVTVRVQGDYYVVANPLSQGQVVAAQDLTKTNGDLTMMPVTIITDPTQAIGRMTTMAMRVGTALREDQLRSVNVIRQGQTVKVVSNGPGFQVSTEAFAMSNAAEGQTAQAKTSSGQVVSGVARAGGILEISN
jgi:flagella basal body P-ring formation protein FlgA